MQFKVYAQTPSGYECYVDTYDTFYAASKALESIKNTKCTGGYFSGYILEEFK